MLAIFLTQPMLTLLLEVFITVILALLLGFVVGKIKGMGAVGLTTLILNFLILLLIAYPISKNRLPLYHIEPSAGQFSPDAASHLVNTYLVIEIAIWTNLFAAMVGYFFSEGHGTLFLALGATIAAALSTVVASVPFYPFGFSNTAWLLVIGLGLVGAGVAWLFNKVVLEDGNYWVLIVLWAEYVLSCWFGYQVAGRAGLLFITLPAQILLGLGLYIVSGHILPHGKGQRKAALRSLVSYNLGTNYPYYIIDDWRTRQTLGQQKPAPHVDGDPGRDYFAGPGIVMTSCDHVAVTATGKAFTVHPPGLNFTEQHQKLYTDIDLRPQNRGIKVKAETKDGIVIEVFAAMPHQMDRDKDAVPSLDHSYPYDEKAIRTAVQHNAMVEHNWHRDKGLATENLREIPWHELVYLKGPAILRNIIATYTCDELHKGKDANNFRDPRAAIASEFTEGLIRAMSPYGIHVLGGGIGNLEVPEDVTKQRISNWKGAWYGTLNKEIAQVEIDLHQQLAKAQSDVRQNFIQSLSEILQDVESDHVKHDLIFLELMEAMGIPKPDKPLTYQALLEVFFARTGIEGE